MGSKEQKPKATWGQNQAQFLMGLRGKEIMATFLDGKVIRGELTGADTYMLFVRQNGGLEIMVAKSALKFLHPAKV